MPIMELKKNSVALLHYHFYEKVKLKHSWFRCVVQCRVCIFFHGIVLSSRVQYPETPSFYSVFVSLII